jgi:transcriptional regulator GlxA family with amidase domain
MPNARLSFPTILAAVAASLWAPLRAQHDSPAAPKQVAVVVYEEVELLDFAGPYEVFHAARSLGGTAGPAFDVYTVGPTKDAVDSMGVTITPKHSFGDAPVPDLIVIPGGGSRNLTQDDRFQGWFAKHHPRCAVVLTVCTGVRAAADAGLLDGGRATTHWNTLAHYRTTYQKVEWLSDVRFVDNGRVVTAAGVSAGIDGALHVVARLLGPEAANATARRMQYDWRPQPADMAAYPRLNPALGEVGQLRQLLLLGRRQSSPPMIGEAVTGLERLGAALADDHAALGRALLGARDLDGAEAAYTKAIAAGVDHPERAYYNLACVRALAGKNDQALDAIEAAIEAGWSDGRHLASDSDLQSLRALPRFQQLCRRLGPDAPGR